MNSSAWRNWTTVETNLCEPRRSVFCSCGWGGVFQSLRAANAAADAHVADGCEGCDHTINMEVIK